ncbi:hypothetical protein BSK59_20155 [Paenibacillus odorifer]|nr:hypothetical protein BSK59_20155 [Paenibacillus odorifer]
MLVAERLIVRKTGRGSFVADASTDQPDLGMNITTSATMNIHSDEKTVGLIIPDFGNSYGTGLIYGMEQASRDNDCFLVLRRTFGIPENEEQAIQKLLDMGVNGLIIFPAQGEYLNAENSKAGHQTFSARATRQTFKRSSCGVHQLR